MLSDFNFDIMRRNFEEDGQRIWSKVFDLLAELASIYEFLVNEIYDITLLQVCKTLECENAAFEGLLGLSLTPDSAGWGAMDVDCKDSAFTPSDSRFGQPVSDDKIFKLIKD